ncbi:hypothetical protein HPB52_022754 [Rhipicephalus sanguineus]|uniref:Uncharacterized protein n=1 Tax=Rhipicephalus sanguineus TaxID=34632 RepID=A0A9D4QAZ7_RHISA|nr:hypothetical protein HPB52_022754 [Rhipicephalus sanguineus]
MTRSDSRLRTILLITITFLVLIGLVGITAFVVLGTGDMADEDLGDNKKARGGAAGDDDLKSKPTISPEQPRKTLPISVTELVCTVGTFAVMPAVIPPDGICTYIFYCDVISIDGALSGIETNASLKVFEDEIQKRAATEGGLSFDIRALSPEHFDNLKLREALNALSQQNVKHYGILNMVTDATHVAANVNKAKLIIDRLKDLQGNDATRKTMIALGLSDYSEPDAWNLYSSQFRVAVERTKADTVFALSSVGSQQSGANCVAVPPAVFDIAKLPDAAEAQSAPFPNLKRHATLVAADVRYGRSNVKLGLSFEMGTLVYKFETNQDEPEKSVYAKCQVGYVTNADVVLNDLSRLSNLRHGMSWLLHNSHLGDFGGTCMMDPFERIQWIKTRFGIQ